MINEKEIPEITLSEEETRQFVFVVWRASLPNDVKKVENFKNLIDKLVDDNVLIVMRTNKGNEKILFNQLKIGLNDTYDLLANIYHKFFEKCFSLKTYEKLSAKVFYCDGKKDSTIYRKLILHYSHQPPSPYKNFFK